MSFIVQITDLQINKTTIQSLVSQESLKLIIVILFRFSRCSDSERPFEGRPGRRADGRHPALGSDPSEVRHTRVKAEDLPGLAAGVAATAGRAGCRRILLHW